MKILISVQLLRSIAAYLVVFCHIPADLIPPEISFLKGAFGVDIFFVISGFIMTRIALDNEQGAVAAWSFFRRRLIRIFPIYLIINLAIFFSVYFKAGVVPNSEFFLQSLLLIPTSGENGILIFPYIGAAWTLSFEIFFYSVVALLTLFKSFNFWNLAGILTILAAFGCFIQPHNAIFGLMVASINIEFLYGASIFVIFKKYGVLFNGYVGIGFIGLALISFSFLGQGAANGAPGPYEGMQIMFESTSLPRFVAWGIPSAFLLYGALCTETRLKNIWLSPVIYKLGDASYSLYLIHAFLIYVMSRFLNMQNPIWIIAILAFVSLSSLMIYRFLERPIMSSLNKRPI